MPGKRWDQLLEIAMEQHGFVATRDGVDLGLPKSYLAKIKARGVVEQAARGLYRFPQVPVTAYTPFMEAVLWVGPDAVLSHDAVLSLHGLANANPRTIRVSTPRRVRKSDPPVAITIVRRTLPGEDLTHFEGIPSTTVARALLDSRDLIIRSRLMDAAHDARAKGLIQRRRFDDLIEQLAQTDA